MRVTLLALVITLGLGGAAYAQDDPAPCGPAGGLAAEFAKNVAPDARCFEIRMYTAEPEKDGMGGIDNLHRRFREGEVGLFEKHGARDRGELAEHGQSEHAHLDAGLSRPGPTARRCSPTSAPTRTGRNSSRSTRCRSISRRS